MDRIEEAAKAMYDTCDFALEWGASRDTKENWLRYARAAATVLSEPAADETLRKAAQDVVDCKNSSHVLISLHSKIDALEAALARPVTLSDDKCCIGPPDKDGRKCTADWLETDESGELHVIEYCLHRPAAAPAPAQEPVALSGDKCPKCGYTTRITMNSDYSPLRARLTEQPTNNSERESSLRDRVGAILARHGIISYPERPSVIAEIVAELEKEPRHAS
jgi:hypothetical protein